jgi:hypothetical protein
VSVPHSNPPKLTKAQARYVVKAFALRRKLMSKALGQRFGVSAATIRDYASGRRGRSYL